MLYGHGRGRKRRSNDGSRLDSAGRHSMLLISSTQLGHNRALPPVPGLGSARKAGQQGNPFPSYCMYCIALRHAGTNVVQSTISYLHIPL